MRQEEKNLKARTISSLFWKFFEQGGNAIVSIVVQIVLARLLAPEQFGALAIMLVFVNIGSVIVQSGLNTALVQNSQTTDDDCSTVLWLSLLVSVVLYLIVYVAAPLISDFYSLASIVWPLRALALILVINAFYSVLVAIIQRELKFNKLFKATLGSVFISGSIGIAIALYGLGLWALVVQQLLYQLCSCCILIFQIQWRPRLVFDKGRAKELFSFGWRLLLSGLIEQGYRSLSDLIIGKQFSASMLGLVSQGKKYPMALGQLINNSIQPVMLSVVSKVQSDVKSVKGIVRRSLKTATFLVFPCMTLFAVIAEPTVGLLLGEQWIPAVPFLQMYCFIYALLPVHTTNLQALNGIGRSDIFLKLEIIKKTYGILFIFFGAFVLQDVYALVGCYMLSGVVSSFVNAWPNRQIIHYSYFEQIKDIFPSILLSSISAVCALAVSVVELPNIITIFSQSIIMIVVYVGLAKLFKVEELTYLLTTVKQLFDR